MNKPFYVLLIAAFLVAASSAALAAEYPVVLYHGVAHVAGLNGTKWRSEVFCSNAEPTAQNVKFELIPRGSTAVQAIKNLEVQAGATLFEGDIYAALEAPDGAGSLRVTGNVLCWVRTFNLDEAHHATYGATVPPYIDNQTTYEAGEEVFFPAQVAANVATGFRTNLLLYNPSNHGLHLTVASGSTSKTYTVGSLQYIQISDLGSNMGLPVGPQTIKVTGDAPWWGYVSIVDPVSGDGATILGLKKPQLPPLTVACTATPQSGDAPLEVTFSSQGTGGDGSYTYDWDFGDGGNATTQNPIHTYTTAGTYTATVTVTSLGKTATCTKEITVGVPCTAPSISSHPASTTICANNTATLSVTATGTGPLHYQWYKGAGTGNPVGTDSNSFTTPNLTVTTSYWCRVSNSCGSADSNMATVTVNPPPAITAWSANQTVLQVGDSTTLSGTITGSGLSWTISQVGGTGSGTVNPASGSGNTVSSTFTATGTGSVTLRLTATGTCGTITQDLTITVAPPPLSITCSADPQSGVAPLTVSFTSTPSGGTGSYSYDWDFGDGSQHATTQNPSHNYTSAGNYTATITVNDGLQSAQCSKSITVTAPNHNPTIDSFTANPNYISNADISNLTATTGDIDGDTVSWTLSVDFSSTATAIFTGPTSGTGNISSQIQATNPGNLVIRADANDGHGGTATATVSITVNP
jgi:PKD repeat protein